MTKKENDIHIAPTYSAGFSIAGVTYNDKDLQDPNVENSGIKNEHRQNPSSIKNHFHVHFKLNKKFYKAKVFVGSFSAFVILTLFIIVPISGFINIPYPLAINQDINNSGNQNLTFNNPVVYRTEYLWKGSSIDFSGSSNKPVSYAIWNNSMNTINSTKESLQWIFSKSFYVERGNYSITSFFLFKGNSLNLGITYPGTGNQYGIPSGNELNLEITDQQINNKSISTKNGLIFVNGVFPNTTYGFQAGYNGISFVAPETGTWNLLWLNPTSDYFNLEYQVTFNYKTSQFNLNQTNLLINNQATTTKQSYLVPQTGFYTLAIISQQNKINESTSVNYNMDFHVRQDAIDGWKSIDPIFSIIASVMFLIVVTSIFFDIDYKKNEYASRAISTEPIHQNEEVSDQQEILENKSFKICPKCHLQISQSDLFCSHCGVRIN